MDRGEAVDEVVRVVAGTAPQIADGLPDRRSYVDGENPSQEQQIEADVWADQLLEDRLTAVDGVGQYASEESDDITDCGDGLAVAVDPL
ncbi:MAG: class 1 fructose-bisphosphatase, partial [Candidatus Nanohaloarchaea archaeon]|nr:class 1 fructose-bisphosphatase [Candidatus Nanohaloarchaea archaeon]